MFPRLIVAGALTAAFTVPSLAAEWNVLKPTPAPADAKEVCLVVERAAAVAGETLIAGPFATEEEGKAAAMAAPACTNQGADGAPSGSDAGSAPGGTPPAPN